MSSVLRALASEIVNQHSLYSTANKVAVDTTLGVCNVKHALIVLVEQMDINGICKYIHSTGGLYHWALHMHKHPRIV